MKKIRIGKDIAVRWPILTNGAPEPLAGRDLTLFIRSQYQVAKQLDFSTEENVVVFTLAGTGQQTLGTYSLTLWENYGKAGQSVVDCCEAFALVACTCEEEPGDAALDAETVDLASSSIELGHGGASCIVGAASAAEFPAVGQAGKLYVDHAENKVYRWEEQQLCYLCVGSDRTDLSALELGGRNLLLKSNTEKRSSDYNFATYDISDLIETGQEVTLTVWGELDDSMDYIIPYNSNDWGNLIPAAAGRKLVQSIKKTGKGSVSFPWRIDNLLYTAYDNEYYNTSKVRNYAFKQITADDRDYLRWKIQAQGSNGEYFVLGNQEIFNDIGRHTLHYTIPKDTHISSIYFGLDGKTIDTKVVLSTTHLLQPGDYTLSFNLDNNVQGEIEFSDISIARGIYDTVRWTPYCSNEKLLLYAFNEDGSKNLTTKIISRIKLEYGNVSTDWTPSPADRISADNIDQSDTYWKLVTQDDLDYFYGATVAKKFEENGYCNLPSGLSIQWGTFTTNSRGTFGLYFPNAFAYKPFAVITTPIRQTSDTAVYSFKVYIANNTQATIYTDGDPTEVAYTKGYFVVFGRWK